MKTIMQEIQTALAKQIDWLSYSHNQALKLPEKHEEWEKSHYDVMESLCARFARGIDFLVRKVFRALDDAEFLPQGTLIDTVHRAHKRNLFENIETIQRIKDLRNQIAHEYADEVLADLFPEVRSLTQELIQMMQNTLVYVDESLNKNDNN